VRGNRKYRRKRRDKSREKTKHPYNKGKGHGTEFIPSLARKAAPSAQEGKKGKERPMETTAMPKQNPPPQRRKKKGIFGQK